MNQRSRAILASLSLFLGIITGLIRGHQRAIREFPAIYRQEYDDTLAKSRNSVNWGEVASSMAEPTS